MKKILLTKMKQDFLGNMKLWCYDFDTCDTVIIFKDDAPNFRMKSSLKTRIFIKQ
ncbi:hypothetical protein Hanom_Chr08g00708581 [Helianthus anomalus]